MIGLVMSFIVSVITVYVFRAADYQKYQRKVVVTADTVEVTKFNAFVIRDSTEYKKTHTGTGTSTGKPASQSITNPVSQSN
jgi:hypothetical protein